MYIHPSLIVRWLGRKILDTPTHSVYKMPKCDPDLSKFLDTIIQNNNSWGGKRMLGGDVCNLSNFVVTHTKGLMFTQCALVCLSVSCIFVCKMIWMKFSGNVAMAQLDPGIF